MREICQHGSEGGGPIPIGPPYVYRGMQRRPVATSPRSSGMGTVPGAEVVENVQGLGNLLRDHAKVRLPHVAAQETDAGPDVVGEYLEELHRRRT